MIKQIFDTKQEETTLSSTGRVLICVNEQEIQVWEDSENEGESPKLVTKYEYDTIWVKPIKQTKEEILNSFKKAIIADIDAYDISDNVNSFILDGKVIWLSVDKRLALKNRLESEKAAGIDVTHIWYGDYEFDLPIDATLSALGSLEVYASHCYDVTAQHKVDIENATSIAEVGAYDITADYPENPSYDI